MSTYHLEICFFSFVWSYLPLNMFFFKRFWPNKINNRGDNRHNNVNSIK